MSVLRTYLKTYVSAAFMTGLAFLFLGVWFIGSLGPEGIWFVTVLFLIIVAFAAAYYTFEPIEKEYRQKTTTLEQKLNLAEQQQRQAEKEEQLWRQTLKERASGFPVLIGAIDEYREAKDELMAEYLRIKKHPAVKASEMLREQAQLRRQAERNAKQTKGIIEYYENIAPFLLDFKDELFDEARETEQPFTDEEREDPATDYLTIEEYRKLPSAVRNQQALDRFWKRPKSKWLLGRMYERYIGYLYEQEGYAVDYVGIFRGYEDLGRDLICHKPDEVVVIQCKNWSQFKTIYEKHIFQFFGTVFQYRDENKGKNVSAIFYTTTVVSDLARRFAKELGIELKEKCKFDKTYPSIKCNISRIDGTKIYHLPFDQQYDNVKVEPGRREFYCATVKEAEDAGFRRAFRYKGHLVKK